jgi:hypothetical protein
MNNAGQWLPVLVDIDRATEFSGDDVDQYSALVDLGADFENVLVIIPTITSSTIGIAIQQTPEISEAPSPVYILDDDATGCFLHATTAATTAMAVKFEIGGARYLRIKCGGNQAADRTFYVRGC